jgi:cob(I)alamin adenosyltransferase
VGRTVARRAERCTWSALDVHGDSVSPLTVKYLNCLLDLLFILSRVAAPTRAAAPATSCGCPVGSTASATSRR